MAFLPSLTHSHILKKSGPGFRDEAVSCVFVGGHVARETGCLETVMDWLEVFLCACGYERFGDQIRVYVDGPTPAPSVARFSGVKTQLFRLFSGTDAESIRGWLARNRAWQCLRVPPPYSTERGARALLLASDWHCGEGSAIYRLARTRTIHDEAHRQQLLREARLLIESVLENPVRDGEFEELQLLEDVVNTAPTGKELATTAEVVDAYFGTVW